MIGRSGERGSGISVLAARHEDDDELSRTISNYLDQNLSDRRSANFIEIVIDINV